MMSERKRKFLTKDDEAIREKRKELSYEQAKKIAARKCAEKSYKNSKSRKEKVQ